MIDPQRGKHSDRRISAQQPDDRQRPGPGVDQPLHRQGQRKHQEQQRDLRRDGHRHPFPASSAKQRLQEEDESGDGQVDQAGPVNICAAVGGIEAVLGKVVPALAFKQGPDLRQPQIIVGVRQAKRLDRCPATADDDDDIEQPRRDEHQAPVAEEQLRHRPLQPLKYALAHLPPPPKSRIVS